MTLDETVDALIGREGRYSNNPHDRGGETMWGVTIAVARAFGYSGPMISMPRSVAVRIYMERYWFAPHLNEIALQSPLIAEELLDTGVNMGPQVAGLFLQRALNVLNRDDKLYPNIAADGVIGKITIAALRAFLSVRGVGGETVLLRMLNAQQSVRYIELAESNVSQEEFEYGWQANRVGGLS